MVLEVRYGGGDHGSEPVVGEQGQDGALVLHAVLEDIIVGRDAVRCDQEQGGLAGFVYLSDFALRGVLKC